ncbi:hypothetical protein THAOC_00875, partial [Thalassiosira oceanica]
QEARVPTRQLPNRKIKTKEKIGSIRDTAADPSRSTGKQTADVSNSRSRFSSTYLSARSAEDLGAEGSDSPHESVASLEEDQTKKSVSFRVDNDLPPARISEAVSIPLEYGDNCELCGYVALYTGRIKNDKPDGKGKLLFEGVSYCHLPGGKKYDVIINGTFREGLLIHGRQGAACGVCLYEGDYECLEADGRLTFIRHGRGEMILHWNESALGLGVVDFLRYQGQFRAGEPDGRGRMQLNADVFKGTFYPTLCNDQHLIPFVGTRTFLDGPTDDGTFILTRGRCYKITDVCFESGFIVLSEYCLTVTRRKGAEGLETGRAGTFGEAFEYITRFPLHGSDGDYDISSVISIDELFKDNDDGVPAEWRSVFEILECERLQRLRNLSAAISHDGCVLHSDSSDVFSIAKSGIDYCTTLLRVYRYLRDKSDELKSLGIIDIEDDIKAFREDSEDTDLSRNIVTNMRYGFDRSLARDYLWYSGATEGGKPCGRGVMIRQGYQQLLFPDEFVVLRGTFSPYQGPAILDNEVPVDFVVEGGHFIHIGINEGNVTTVLYCMYDGPFDNNLVIFGQGKITYPENEDGYRQYEGSLSVPRLLNDVGWYDQGTLTLTDGTTYSGVFLDDDEEKNNEESGEMYVHFCGKCVLPGGVVREGTFRLVDPIMRMYLCGQFGVEKQREKWEADVEIGYHNLEFDDWVDRQIDSLAKLKCQSTTPVECCAHWLKRTRERHAIYVEYTRNHRALIQELAEYHSSRLSRDRDEEEK